MREQLFRQSHTRQGFPSGSLAGSDDLVTRSRDLNDTSSFNARDSSSLDPVLLAHEVRRLTEIQEAPVRHRSPTRRNHSPSVALRSMRAAAGVAASSSSTQLGSQSPASRYRAGRPLF